MVQRTELLGRIASVSSAERSRPASASCVPRIPHGRMIRTTAITRYIRKREILETLRIPKAFNSLIIAGLPEKRQ